MRVFVAGGTGQLGLATIPNLIRAGHAVRATARGEDKAAALRTIGAEPLDVDLFDSAALGLAIRGCDAVLRLTTKIPALPVMRSRKSWDANNRLRTEGARALVDATLAEGIGRYVSESVTFLYAGDGDGWVTEEAPIATAGVPILEATASSEAEADRVTSAGGAGVVLRFGSFYSASSDQTRRIAGLVRKRLFPLIGKGDNYYASIAVADAGAAVTAALELAPGLYNVVDDEPLPYRDYVRTFADVVGGPSPLRAPRVAGVPVLGADIAEYLFRSSRVSNRRLKEASTWRPEYPTLRAGLEAIAAELKAA
ncbi:MAG: hypothetical protein QOK05_2519 [Chloroflexota bacterium]|jgi:nucleoside-diphosphate-sugar epimerase|nr:hypothetical protein [Chloroflexota bacterium]